MNQIKRSLMKMMVKTQKKRRIKTVWNPGMKVKKTVKMMRARIESLQL
jgi:hypothetical protein